MGHEHFGRPRGAEPFDARLDRPVEPAPGLGEHQGTALRRPLRHLGVVAHHGDGQRARGGEDTGCHLPGQSFAPGGVEGGGEARLGRAEGFHGDEHHAARQGGQAHRRCGHAASVWAPPTGGTRS